MKIMSPILDNTCTHQHQVVAAAASTPTPTPTSAVVGLKQFEFIISMLRPDSYFLSCGIADDDSHKVESKEEQP